MPPKAKVLRKLRGKVTLMTRHRIAVSLYAKGSDEIFADLKRKDMPKNWAFAKFQIFEYIIVSPGKGKPHKVVLRKVKEKHLSKKQIKRIERSVREKLSGITEF